MGLIRQIGRLRTFRFGWMQSTLLSYRVFMDMIQKFRKESDAVTINSNNVVFCWRLFCRC